MTKKTLSARLHNENCQHYLSKLVVGESLKPYLPKVVQTILQKSQARYDASLPYADWYTTFFQVTEQSIDEIAKKIAERENDPLSKEMNAFLNSIYHNDNQILERTHEEIKSAIALQSPANANVKSRIKEHLSQEKNTIADFKTISPLDAESTSERLNSVLGSQYKPQHTTSLSTLRSYEYNKDSECQEYRFGTQGQRHQGQSRVNPLFKHFLKAQALAESPEKITHIYFNNLKRDVNDLESKVESRLTYQLHQLEEAHQNIAVITLPADRGIMGKEEFTKITPLHEAKDVYNEFLAIALEDAQHLPKEKQTAFEQELKDFHISPRIREQVFGDKVQEQSKLRELLQNSFTKLGISDTQKISDAQKQALWFDFIKFELPNFVIDKLNPKGFNFSCKDAIDRGGVSSAYYNLLKSLHTPTPLSQDEFERALHAAPAMVKGRGMNHHLNLIWNAVDAYVSNPYNNNENRTPWLTTWRDQNCPPERAAELFERRFSALIKDINDSPSASHEVKEAGIHLLQMLKTYHDLSASSSAWLLDTALKTVQQIQNPAQDIHAPVTEFKNKPSEILKTLCFKIEASWYTLKAHCCQMVGNDIKAHEFFEKALKINHMLNQNAASHVEAFKNAIKESHTTSSELKPITDVTLSETTPLKT